MTLTDYPWWDATLPAAPPPASTSGSPFPSLDDAFPPAGNTGAGNWGWELGLLQGLGVYSQDRQPGWVNTPNKAKAGAVRGASKREAPQLQGDIPPSGKMHPWGGSRGSALPGGPLPDVGGCRHAVGTFSRCRSLAGEGHVVAAARAGPGAARPPPPRGVGREVGGGPAGVTPRATAVPGSPRDWPGRGGAGDATRTPPRPAPDPPGGLASPLAVMSKSSPMMSQAVAMEIA